MNESSRDRAYDRIVVIDTKDKGKLEAILENIPRADLIKSCTTVGVKTGYLIKVKKIELLTIKLSITGVTVDKPSWTRKANKHKQSKYLSVSDSINARLRHGG